VSAQAVEVERSKVRLMASALVESLRGAGVEDGARRAVLEGFLARLRALEDEDGLPAAEDTVPGALALPPDDEELL
jgi:hypothetical protein